MSKVKILFKRPPTWSLCSDWWNQEVERGLISTVHCALSSRFYHTGQGVKTTYNGAQGMVPRVKLCSKNWTAGTSLVSRPDMREKGRRKKGRTWAEAAKTVRRRERTGRLGGFRSLAALPRSQGKGGQWHCDPAKGGTKPRGEGGGLCRACGPCGNGGA